MRLKQRKHQLQLETEIAKAEAEEKAYAMIETLGNYDKLPSHLPNPVLRHERWHQFEPQPKMTRPNQDPHQLTMSDNYIQPSSPPFKPTPQVGECQHENLKECKFTQQQFSSNDRAQQAKPFRKVQQPDIPKVGSPDDSEVAEKFLYDMLDIQRQQQQQSHEMFQMQQARDHQLQQLLGQHQQLALRTMLPNVQVPTYSGDPIEY